ncbi:hypothetical protein C1878_05440 [Gordonibacter sp. 28C]|nr:hypothetical protein C1878_05440 [Gordonibacter sp. 28C]
MPGELGGLGAPGAPGALGIPGAPAAPGAPGMGGMDAFGSSAPHFGHASSSGLHISPQAGHVLSGATVAGLKHI